MRGLTLNIFAYDKTLILLLFSIILLGLGSCTKLESCDCGIEGKFVYFENGKNTARKN